MKIRLPCEIWVLYLQNQPSYIDFSFIKVMQNLHFTKFWNPEILLKFWDFWLIFCMWPPLWEPQNPHYPVIIKQKSIKIHFISFVQCSWKDQYFKMTCVSVHVISPFPRPFIGWVGCEQSEHSCEWSKHFCEQSKQALHRS